MARPQTSGDREYLNRLVACGAIQKLDRGLYLHAPANITEGHEFAAVAVRLPVAVIGLTSALAYHQLTTHLPQAVSLGLEAGRHAPRWTWPAISPFYLSPRSHRTGIEVVSMEGIPVHITTPARTVVECWYHRDRVGSAICLEGLRIANQERRCTMDDIWVQAAAFRIEDTIRPYAEAFATTS
jgi:predicted transcriptional regulator of viral defense system